MEKIHIWIANVEMWLRGSQGEKTLWNFIFYHKNYFKMFPSLAHFIHIFWWKSAHLRQNFLLLRSHQSVSLISLQISPYSEYRRRTTCGREEIVYVDFILQYYNKFLSHNSRSVTGDARESRRVYMNLFIASFSFPCLKHFILKFKTIVSPKLFKLR